MATIKLPGVMRHPKTGMLWLRRVVPPHLREHVGQREFRLSLGTKDIAAAKARYHEVAAQVQRRIDQAQHELDGARYLQEQQEAADRLADLQDAFLSTLSVAQRQLWYRLAHAEALKQSRPAGPTITPDEMLEAVTMPPEAWPEERAADRPADRPTAPPARPQDNGRGNGKLVTLDHLLTLWAAASQPSPRTVTNWRAQVRKAVEWWGHEDASRITREDVQAFLDHLLTIRAPKTVADMRTILNLVLGFGEERGLIADNPVAKTKVRAKTKAVDKVRPYNDDEAKAIIEAAKGQPQDSVLRHLPNLLRITGARIEELAGLRLRDVQSDAEGLWLVLEDHERRTLKNASSARLVPLSMAHTDPAFLQFVERRRRGGQPDDLLWTDITPDQAGRLGPNLSKRISRLVRLAGVTDPRTAPSHSWRHRAADKMRETPGMADELRHRLLGHTSGNIGSKYGSGFNLATLRAAIDKVEF
jgi:integrase